MTPAHSWELQDVFVRGLFHRQSVPSAAARKAQIRYLDLGLNAFGSIQTRLCVGSVPGFFAGYFLEVIFACFLGRIGDGYGPTFHRQTVPVLASFCRKSTRLFG